MKTIRLIENDQIISEHEYKPELIQTMNLDLMSYRQDHPDSDRRVEVYEPPPPPPPLSEQKERAVARIKAESTRRIYEAGATEHKQRNAALGLETAETTEWIKATIDAHRSTVEAAEFDIDDAATGAEVEAIVEGIAWP